MLICICRLHYEFERVFPSSLLWTFKSTVVAFWSSFPYLLSWPQSKFSILNSWLILEHSISYEKISFLPSVSFHIFQTSIFHFLLLYFFSSKSPLGHNISCLMIYLGAMFLISFILHQEPYLLFDLIKFNDLLFLLYLISISITRGQ